MRTQQVPRREIAESLGKTVRQVDRQLDKLPKIEADTTTEYWKERALKLEREFEKLERGQTATEVLIEQIRDIAPVSYSPHPAVRVVTPKGASSPQSAVLMLSDTHVGAKVRAEQTLGFGEYNFDVFRRRLKRHEDSAASILNDHTTTEISELVVPMIGDMIDGALQHAAECGQVNTLFSQFYGAGHAIAQFLRNLSALVPSVRVYTCVGNHPRWGTQHKMPTKNRFSNLDQFLYAYIEALVRDIPTIKFRLDQQPFAEFQVQGFTFLAAHGDHLRGGDKALGIPSHSIGRAISATTQIRVKHERPGVNYYLLGHLHRPMEIPHALGEVLVNGGYPGVDEFGLTNSFTPCSPIQKFFFVHPKFGRSACYNLSLAKVNMDGPAPYDIPAGFDVL